MATVKIELPKLRIRCVAQQPVLLFGKWIYPGDTREISWKQWAVVQDKYPDAFELVISVQQEGGHIELKAEPAVWDVHASARLELADGQSVGIEVGETEPFEDGDRITAEAEFVVAEIDNMGAAFWNHPDPSARTVAEIKKLDLTPGQWADLLIQERNGKNRATVIGYAQRQIAGE